MSRAVAAPSNDLHLVVGHGPSGPVLTVSKIPVSGSITMTRNDYLAFRFYMLQIFHAITQGSIQTKGKNTTNTPYEKIAKNADVFKEIVFCFYARIARLIAPGLSEHEQLERTARALYSSKVIIPSVYYTIRRPIKEKPGTLAKFCNPNTWNTWGRCFFDMSVVQRVTSLLPQLLDLTLNAVENVDEIKRIVNRTRPEGLSILLNTPSTAHINHLQHLNIQRTGTPLQMALYGGDEDVVSYLKTIMDPAEFERQSKTVFRNALPLEKQTALDEQKAPASAYQNAMFIVQHAEAEKLCNDAFQSCVVDDKNQFTINDETVADFQQKLTDYVRKTPAHNSFILRFLYAIYDRLPGAPAEDGLFSEKALGLANALSSARWLQHYAQGICQLGYGDDCSGIPERTRRSFACRDSNPAVDVRSLIPSRLGVDSFLTANKTGVEPSSGGVIETLALEKFCRAKIASFRNLLRGQSSELVSRGA